MKNDTLLIVGASGGTGRQAVLRALAAGYEVRAWSRHAGELPLRHPRLTHVEGDVRDAATARRAVRGVGGVLSALGSTAGLTRTTLCADGTRVLVDAMWRHRVRRLVVVTSLGTTHKLGPVHKHVVDPLLLSRIYDDKREQERVVRLSGLDWVLVRPGRLTDRPASGRERVVFEGPLPGVTVARSAVARFAVEQLRSVRFVHLAPYSSSRCATAGCPGTRCSRSGSTRAPRNSAAALT